MKLILTNSGWLVFDKIIRMAIGVSVGAAVARYLGPESFGQLSYIVTYVGLFQTVATLGLDGLVVRDIARNGKTAGDVLGTTFILRLGAGSLCWLICIGVMMITKGPRDPYVFLSSILGANLVFLAADAVDLWFQSQMQSRRTVLAKLCACLVSNVLKVLLIYFKAPLYWFAAILAFEVAAGAMALAGVYRYFPAPESWRYRGTVAKNLLLESWPFITAGAVNMIQARVEFVMIESILGAAALGQYAAAARFIEIFDMVFASLAASIYPRVARHESGTSDATIRKVYLLAILTYVGITPILVLVWLFIGVIYGARYQPARDLYPFMAIRPLLAYIGLTKSIAMRINSKSEYALVSSTIGAIFAAIAAYFLLPRYGLYGAVFASLFSYLLSNVLIDAIFYRSNFRNFAYCWKEWPYFTGIITGA